MTVKDIIIVGIFQNTKVLIEQGDVSMKLKFAFILCLLLAPLYASSSAIAEQLEVFCFDSVSISTPPDIDDLVSDEEHLSNFPGLPWEDQYLYFSSNYRDRIQRLLGIDDSDAYSKKMSNRFYKRNLIDFAIVDARIIADDFLAITYLLCWEQEGYEGMSSVHVVFDNSERREVVDLNR